VQGSIAGESQKKEVRFESDHAPAASEKKEPVIADASIVQSAEKNSSPALINVTANGEHVVP